MKIAPRSRRLNPIQEKLEHGGLIVAMAVTERILIEIGL